jgi:spermidine/putrescine transport system substrate-binding protein
MTDTGRTPFMSPLTRLELIKRGGAGALGIGGLSALLAACGADTSSDGSDSAASAGKVGQLDYFSWEGYDFPDKGVPTMKAWKKSEGVNLKAAYMSTHDEIQAKIKSGAAEGLDLITYVSQYAALYTQLGFLTPLDEEKLPNLKNLLPFFQGDFGNFWVDADGNRTGVPMYWGAMALNYDEAEIPEAPPSYDIVLESKYKGKVAMPDDPHAVFGMATVILDLDYAKLTPDDLGQVTDYLAAIIRQTNGLSASYGDVANRLSSGEAVIGFPGWAAVGSFAANAGKKTIKTTVPREGGFGFCDAYAIPSTADNVDGALAWINQGLDPKVNAEAANYVVGATVCSDSVDKLTPDVKALYPYADVDTFLNDASWVLLPPAESDEFVTITQAVDAWNELKAAA